MMVETMALPIIIQGGMGVGVSDWRLARAVSVQGQMGVVSGTAMDLILARRLQLGDPDESIRRALVKFPFQKMACNVLGRYFIRGGKSSKRPFKPMAMMTESPTQEQLELLVVANFVEVYLAKEGHNGLVGVNLLEKIQLPTLPSLFGAMLAGVDYVLMGAGIPRHIPEMLDRMARGESTELPLIVDGADANDHYTTRFDLDEFTCGRIPSLKRPKFLAIVASATLATMLAKKSTGNVDGFVIEGPTAGGHNASPRGKLNLNFRGEPIYGERDKVDLATFRKLGLPFWLAGSYGTPRRVNEALQMGASGVQIGTAFAFCKESGMNDELKRKVLRMSRLGETDVFTDPVASPTGFPLKVLRMKGTLSEQRDCEHRKRVCDLGYLRHAYKKQDGSIGWRCPGERVASYLKKGGCQADTVGRKCVCNGLVANIGLAQYRPNAGFEKVLVTCGNEVKDIHQFLSVPDANSYSAKQVIERLLDATGSPNQVKNRV